MLASKIALSLAAIVTATRPLLAQQPPPSAADTGYAVIFSEDIASNAPWHLTLSSHTAYRVDIIPGGVLTIVLEGGGPVPLVLHPLENPALIEGGQSFLITPTVSGDYRLTVSFRGTPTHIRIARDPHELALLQGRAKPSLAMMTLGIRLVGLSGARTILTTDAGTDLYTSGAVAAGEMCLGLQRGRFGGLPRLGGCLMTVGLYGQGNGGATLEMVGTNPDYLLDRTFLGFRLSAAPVVAFGRATVRGRTDVSYWIIGGGVNAGWNVLGLRALELAISPGVVVVHQGGYNIAVTPAHNSPASNTLALRLATGLSLHL